MIKRTLFALIGLLLIPPSFIAVLTMFNIALTMVSAANSTSVLIGALLFPLTTITAILLLITIAACLGVFND